MKNEDKNSKQNGWVKVSNPLIKQGNSYCVRIPKKAIEALNAVEGELLAIKIKRLEGVYEFTPQTLQGYIKWARKCPSLKRWSPEKIRVLGLISHLWLEQAFRCKGDSKKALKLWTDFRKKIKQEFGEKLLKDWDFFSAEIAKKAKALSCMGGSPVFVK